MGHGKETPRQKMIGMMYLFLTCLLALNVSKDILDAFIKINNEMMTTNQNFVTKNNKTYDDLEKKASLNPQKAGAANTKAIEIKAISDSLVQIMQDYKHLCIITADGLPDTTTVVFDEDEKKNKPLELMVTSKDNSDAPAQRMILEKGGEKLKASIEEYRAKLISYLDTNRYAATVGRIKNSLSTEDPPKKPHETANVSWESANFEHLPLMAVVTILTQMQAAVRNSEGEVVSILLNSLDADDVKVNKLESIVIPNSSYVMQGGEYKAKMLLAAYDTTSPPIVTIGKLDSVKNKTTGQWEYLVKNGKKLPTEKGMAVLKRSASSLGEQNYEGIIQIVKNGTDTMTFPIHKQTYQVAAASLVVSPTKMNVFYVGVENPVEISVPGIASSKLNATMSSGSIYKKGKGYAVKVKRPGKVRVNVSAKIGGKSKAMGSKEFRVKKVPDPVAKVAGEKGGLIAHSKLRAAKQVIASMENFDFDLRFNITQFTVSTKTKDGYVIDKKSTGGRITSEQKSLIANARKGQKLYFEEIKARGPDGSIRNLGTLMFKIK